MAAANTTAASAAGPAELSEVVGNYRLGIKVGAGSFGEIYVAVDIETGEKYAAKLEPLNTKNPQLFYEYKVYKSIKKGMGVPKVYYYGVTPTHSVMIMDLLGQSLEGLFNICSRNFSMKTILMLAIQLIDRIEYLHGNCFLHRDIKPDNFLIGAKPTDSHVVYMVDLGLCKRYRDAVSKRHIPARNNKKLTGTPRYASIHTHNGCEQGRRDDLESLGYLLVYLSRGTLPWQGLKAGTKQEKYDKIGKKKQEISIDELCEDIPEEFATYLKYCCKLAFTEKPDYLFLKSLFDSLFRKQGYEYDWIYDWDDLATHELYIQRLQASKLRHSSSEIGLKQIRQQVETLKMERDQYKAKCEQQELLINELKGQIRPTQANGTKQSSGSTDSAPLLRKRKRATRSKRI